MFCFRIKTYKNQWTCSFPSESVVPLICSAGEPLGATNDIFAPHDTRDNSRFSQWLPHEITIKSQVGSPCRRHFSSLFTCHHAKNPHQNSLYRCLCSSMNSREIPIKTHPCLHDFGVSGSAQQMAPGRHRHRKGRLRRSTRQEPVVRFQRLWVKMIFPWGGPQIWVHVSNQPTNKVPNFDSYRTQLLVLQGGAPYVWKITPISSKVVEVKPKSWGYSKLSSKSWMTMTSD